MWKRTKRSEQEPARVCLSPVWPQRDTGSWVGGEPQLPDGVEWPMLEGRPAAFLAQVSLEGLPATLWQGLGPRTGWLVFFCDHERTTSVAIHHVTGQVRPVSQLAGTQHNWSLTSEHEALAAALGPAGQVPPRWFVEVTDQETLGAVEDMQAGDPAHWDDDAGAWIWEHDTAEEQRTAHDAVRQFHRNGVDWPSFFVLFELLAAKLHDDLNFRDHCIDAYATRVSVAEQHERIDRSAEQGNVSESKQAAQKVEVDRKEARQAELDAEHRSVRPVLQELLAEMDSLRTDLRAQSEHAPFSEEVGSALEDLLQRIADRLGKWYEPVTLYRAVRAYAIESYARHVFTTAPETLHPDLRALFEPLWAAECEQVHLFLGLNRVDQNHRLIDLPPNPLTGTTFGDASRFYIDIPAGALVEGDWSKADSNDTHGVY